MRIGSSRAQRIGVGLTGLRKSVRACGINFRARFDNPGALNPSNPTKLVYSKAPNSPMFAIFVEARAPCMCFS